MAIPSDAIDKTFAHTTNLASSALNSTILSCSNEYFASATNLLTPSPPINRPGVFIHTGAWYDGWETRRHNPEPYDWAVIKLGVASAVIKGIEIDTGFFGGNYGEKAEVQATYAPASATTTGATDEEIARADFQGWETILAAKECGPKQRRAWWVETGHEAKPYTHVRVLMYPDGGFGRVRLYGHAIAPPLDSASGTGTSVEELSSALVGGQVLAASDQHFTPCSNVLLPGRGENMGDGWETARSRAPGHVDWAIVKLGLPGSVARVVVDTKDFRGNFPRAVRVHGLVGEDGGDRGDVVPAHDDPAWEELMRGEMACKADTEHVFEGGDLAVGDGDSKVFTFVKLTLVPDGGVKRFRILGRRA